MAILKYMTTQSLEELFDMTTGYVIDFSNSSFQRFIKGIIDIDIYNDKGYEDYCSKANKLRQVFENESNAKISKLISALLNYYEDYKLKNDNLTDYDKKKINEIKKDIEDLNNYVDETIEHDAIFNEIKDTIIQSIRSAKYTIWVAVAWFTDEEIFNELLLRKKDGVHIRIITSDESSNKYLLNKLEANFEVKKISLKGEYLSNRLHDKFCIIDFEFVMHGSYNWSKNARYNNETLATALDKNFVKKFADEFIKLYLEN